jgi:hypothetical protein
MSSSKAVPEVAKDQFWAVVEDCLQEFHGQKQEMSRRKANKLRNSVERMTTAEVELFYHSEPFDVACEIAGAPLEVDVYLERYLQIRDEEHGSGIAAQKVHSGAKTISKD